MIQRIKTREKPVIKSDGLGNQVARQPREADLYIHSLFMCVGGETRKPQPVCGGQRRAFRNLFSLGVGSMDQTQIIRVSVRAFTHWAI